MTHRTSLVTLVLALGAATCMAGEQPRLRPDRLRAACDKLDWQISVAAYTFRKFTFFETVDKVAELGLDRVEGFSSRGSVRRYRAAQIRSRCRMRSSRRSSANYASAVTLIALYYGRLSSRRGHVSNGV